MHCILKSLKGLFIGDYIGEYYRGYSGEYWELRLWLMGFLCIVAALDDRRVMLKIPAS